MYSAAPAAGPNNMAITNAATRFMRRSGQDIGLLAAECSRWKKSRQPELLNEKAASAVSQFHCEDRCHQGKRRGVRSDQRPVANRDSVDQPEQDTEGKGACCWQ